MLQRSNWGLLRAVCHFDGPRARDHGQRPRGPLWPALQTRQLRLRTDWRRTFPPAQGLSGRLVHASRFVELFIFIVKVYFVLFIVHGIMLMWVLFSLTIVPARGAKPNMLVIAQVYPMAMEQTMTFCALA